MSRHIAPYGIRFREYARIEVFPAIDVLMFGMHGRGLRAAFHIDSGASASILPLADAGALGMPAVSGKRALVRGISGDPLIGHRANIKLQIGSFGRIAVPVLFVDGAGTPRILGREGVFDRYGILFDEMQRRTGWFDGKERRAMNALFEG